MAEPDTELLAKPVGKQSRADSGDESEDEGEVLEESPCGRWQKRREEVEQRDVPGIDYAFLAMDTEEGVEVVWNEVQFSEKRDFRAQQDKIRQVFDNLIQLDHPNIVKFHTYWTDTKGDKPRVIFITEYMSSGSLKQFLKKTKKNNKTFQLKSWKKWCTQILSALSYLHSCDPPIIHGNLTCDTVFIQHNGLIKIGSVAPDAIHHHVKTFRKDLKNMHCIAPEYGGREPVTTAIDIYSFGMCALEMAALEIHGNGDSGNVTVEAIQKTIESLEDPREKDFFVRSLSRDPRHRPTARELLFHAVLFEVHSLKLLSAHCFIKNAHILPENITDETCLTRTDDIQIIAEIHHQDGREPLQWRFNQVPALELEKLLEDVKNGIYPLTALSMPQPPHSRPRAVTPEVTESVKSETPEPVDVEPRIIISMDCRVRQKEDEVETRLLTLTLRMDDKMNRQLTCEVATNDTPGELAEELVHYGFINEMDREKIASLILDNMKRESPVVNMVNGTSSPVGVISA